MCMFEQVTSLRSPFLSFETADENQKTIGKDAALEHHFQPVQMDEPSAKATVSFFRGLEPRYEVIAVRITNSALVTSMSPCALR